MTDPRILAELKRQHAIETVAWVIGMVLLGVGSFIAWGWAGPLISIGGIFVTWPLVKEIARR